MNIALAPFLRSCPSVFTLGIRACIAQYSEEERDLLRRARCVFFPTPRFLEVFKAMEKRTFPSYSTYKFQRSHILQQSLFQYLEVPHPRTRIYFGKRQKARIPDDFEFPLILMGPEVIPAASTVHVVDGQEALSRLTILYNPVLIQKMFDWEERGRFLCVNREIIGAHLSPRASGKSSQFDFEPVPDSHLSIQKPMEVTRLLLSQVDLDDIVIDWGCAGGLWRIIGMRRPPVRWRSFDRMIDRHEFIGRLIESERLRSGDRHTKILE